MAPLHNATSKPLPPTQNINLPSINLKTTNHSVKNQSKYSENPYFRCNMAWLKHTHTHYIPHRLSKTNRIGFSMLWKEQKTNVPPYFIECYTIFPVRFFTEYRCFLWEKRWKLENCSVLTCDQDGICVQKRQSTCAGVTVVRQLCNNTTHSCHFEVRGLHWREIQYFSYSNLNNIQGCNNK